MSASDCWVVQRSKPSNATSPKLHHARITQGTPVSTKVRKSCSPIIHPRGNKILMAVELTKCQLHREKLDQQRFPNQLICELAGALMDKKWGHAGIPIPHEKTRVCRSLEPHQRQRNWKISTRQGRKSWRTRLQALYPFIWSPMRPFQRCYVWKDQLQLPRRKVRAEPSAIGGREG